MKKILFVDHAYHKKTKSSDFLRKILKEKFIVNDCWIDKSLEFKSDIFQYENIFFHQIFPPLKILRKLKNKNIIWSPMYDSPLYPIGYSWLLWRIIKFYNIKIISFSDAITKQIYYTNIKCFKLKYYEKSKQLKNKKNKKIKIFFWDRNEIKLENWINKFNLRNISKIFYLKIENNKSISETEQKIKKKIFYINKKFSKNNNNFRKLLKKADVFVCPRKKEGIGMAMIEALSYGKYIIANNDNTMNEYIKNKKIGLFIDDEIHQNRILDYIFKNYKYRLQHNAKGYKRYLKKEKNINSFVLKKQNNFNKNLIFEIIIIIMYYFKIVFRKVHLVLKKI